MDIYVLDFLQKRLHYNNIGLSKWSAGKYEMTEVTLPALLFHSVVHAHIVQSRH